MGQAVGALADYWVWGEGTEVLDFRGQALPVSRTGALKRFALALLLVSLGNALIVGLVCRAFLAPITETASCFWVNPKLSGAVIFSYAVLLIEDVDILVKGRIGKG